MPYKTGKSLCEFSTESETISGISVPFDPEKTRTAQLFLNKSSRIGTGGHSYVYRASLRPHNVVSVAAKLCRYGEDESLDQEANMYAGFEKHFAEEWSGFNIVPGVTRPVRAKAVVPKFYGYYVAEEQNDEKESEGDGDAQKTKWRRNHCCEPNSPILLLEDCGTRLEPKALTQDQRYVLPFEPACAASNLSQT
jgi:hypothetical protein